MKQIRRRYEARGGGRVNNVGLHGRMTARSWITGAGVPTCTSIMAAAATATGATACMTMHSGQWSASLSRGWTWAIWTTASNASRRRHTTVATANVRGLAVRGAVAPCAARRSLPRPDWIPASNIPAFRLHRFRRRDPGMRLRTETRKRAFWKHRPPSSGTLRLN